MSLLATFKKQSTNNANTNTHNDDITICNEDNVADDDSDMEESKSIVVFDATVMAAIIAEATAEADQDQFFGASFEQLQMWRMHMKMMNWTLYVLLISLMSIGMQCAGRTLLIPVLVRISIPLTSNVKYIATHTVILN
jgi:hypothetical protein